MRFKVDDLAVERGGEIIFSGVGFAVGAGEALIISGHNGAGKSTLLAALAGLLPIRSGAILLDGLPDQLAEARREELCHYLGPQNALKPALTVRENLDFWQQLGEQAHLSIDDALDMVGLGDIGHIPFGHLSTGQRRRIAIAKLLVAWRPVWLLDEPTSGLDKASEAQFAALMKAHLEDEGIIVAATHIPLDLPGAQSLVMGEAASSHGAAAG